MKKLYRFISTYRQNHSTQHVGKERMEGRSK